MLEEIVQYFLCSHNHYLLKIFEKMRRIVVSGRVTIIGDRFCSGTVLNVHLIRQTGVYCSMPHIVCFYMSV